MKKKISSNDCKAMFNDKLGSLSMKELGIELKHFAVGTAPEAPSFLVNQDELKKKIIEKFSNFFDEDKSQGLEVIFLKSNYGNGKTHFIRTIYSFFSNFENVLVKKVSLKQQKTDLKIKILEGVGHKVIKECATFLVNNSIEGSDSNDKSAVLLTLAESLTIDFSLAELLYQAAYGDDISKQTQAIAILKGNYLPDYLKSFKLKKGDLNNEFYFNVIRLVCNYLLINNVYLVIVFDEYEHINSWNDEQSRKTFFSDIKYFTDNIDPYKNLFFVFAESEAGDNNTEAFNDPAYVSRKRNLTYTISDISSDAEIEKLYKMIKNRYEKYYEISLDEYSDQILKKVKDDQQVKTNSNYRNYTHVIMKVLELYRNKPQKNKKVKKVKKSISKSTENEVITENQKLEYSISLSEKWQTSNSISKRTILCNALEDIINKSNENIIEKSKKVGMYKTQKDDIIKGYYIIATDRPTHNDFTKRYNNALKTQEENEITTFRMLYPYKDEISNEFKHDNVIFYYSDKVPSILDNIYKIIGNIEKIEDVDKYLYSFGVRD